MTIRFDGRVAIVTGAGTGLGKCYALELARRGAAVVVNDFGGGRDGAGGSASPAEAVAAEIRAGGGKAIANAANVADAGQCREMAAAALSAYGRIDILIANAGILRDKSLAKMAAQDWNPVLDVHLAGSANCVVAVWSAMKEAGYGRILLTTSTSGLYGNFGQANYGAAKMGLVGLMNTACIEGAKSGIRVNCIAPTAATRMTADILNAEMLDMLKPEFVAPAALFLVSEDAPNRTIMLAGAGHFACVEIRESAGLHLHPAERTPEAIAARFAEIADMAHAAVYRDGASHVGKILSAETAMRKRQ
jgi:NAD(P)-dependent dehydrogenase (short-subunit alcohol dehydrogenase family)